MILNSKSKHQHKKHQQHEANTLPNLVSCSPVGACFSNPCVTAKEISTSNNNCHLQRPKEQSRDATQTN